LDRYVDAPGWTLSGRLSSILAKNLSGSAELGMVMKFKDRLVGERYEYYDQLDLLA
jgi:hypothetical protein